jgi:hypothetical protein
MNMKYYSIHEDGSIGEGNAPEDHALEVAVDLDAALSPYQIRNSLLLVADYISRNLAAAPPPPEVQPQKS